MVSSSDVRSTAMALPLRNLHSSSYSHISAIDATDQAISSVIAERIQIGVMIAHKSGHLDDIPSPEKAIRITADASGAGDPKRGAPAASYEAVMDDININALASSSLSVCGHAPSFTICWYLIHETGQHATRTNRLSD